MYLLILSVLILVSIGALIYYFKTKNKPEKIIPVRRPSFVVTFPKDNPTKNFYVSFELSRNMLKTYRKHLQQRDFNYFQEQTPQMLHALRRVKKYLKAPENLKTTPEEEQLYELGDYLFENKVQLLEQLYHQLSKAYQAGEISHQQAVITMLNLVNKIVMQWNKVLVEPVEFFQKKP